MAFNLALTSPTYDTTAEKSGTAALNGGYGVTAAAPYLSAVPFTAEAWVKLATAPSGTKVALGQTAVFWIGALSSGNLQAVYTGASGADVTLATNSNIATNAWAHVALVVTSAGGTLYLNGTSVATSATAPVPNSGSQTNKPLAVRDFGGQQGGTLTWTGEVDEVAIWNIAKYTGNFTPPTQPYTGTETGQKSLYHLDSNGNDSTVPTGTTIPVNSPAFKFSPGNWKGDTGRGGSVYRQSWNNGAWFEFVWNAGASPSATILLPSSPASNMVSYFLNGVLTDNVAANGNITVNNVVASAQNTLIVFLRNSTQASRWNNGTNVVQVQGMLIDTASSVGAAPAANPWALIIGDSITEGIETNGGADDNLLDYSFLVGQALTLIGYDYGVSACGYSGWLRPGDSAGDVPAYYSVSGSSGGIGGTYSDAASRWNKIDQGVSLLDTAGQISSYGSTGTAPSIIFINYMTNEALNASNLSDSQASVTQALTALRAAAPNAYIFIQVPFGIYVSAKYLQTYVTALKAGVAAYQAAYPADSKVVLIDFGPAISAMLNNTAYINSDAVHPLAAGHAVVAPMVMQAIQKSIGGKGLLGNPTYY